MSQQTIQNNKSKISSNLVRATISSDIKSGCWYLFEGINVLFCGDTALAEFRERTPEATLASAITSDDWDHDWLIERVNNLIVLQKSYITEGMIEQIISLFSGEGDTIVMPWLPDTEMLAIAYRMKRRIIAGDPSPQRCQKAIAQLGVAVEQSNF